MLKIHRWFILVGVIFIVFIFLSIDFNSTGTNNNFNKWVKEFSKNADKSTISQNVIDNFKQTVQLNESLVNGNNNIPHDDKSSIYKSLNTKVNESVLLYAQVTYKDNKELLKEIENEYKVPVALSLAIVGIGSNFGNNMAQSKLLDTLATLAFLNQDKPEYVNELTNFLQLVTIGYVDINVMGKNNGTFTQLGILPSIYLKQGVDRNQDGKVDLINSKEDIFATAAKLVANGRWEGENTWGNQIIIPNTLDLQTQQGVKNARSVEDWKALGIVKNNGEMLPMIKSSAALILFDDVRSGILLYDNFNVIYNINNNLTDALAIGVLSDKINDYIHLLEYGEKKVKPVTKPKVSIPTQKHENVTIRDKYKDIIK